MLIRNFLILGLGTVITFGLLVPGPGLAANELRWGVIGLPQVAIFCMFIISGLCLESGEDLRQPKALFLGSILVLCITPLVAFPVWHLGSGHVNRHLLEGMAVFCLVPTTLSAGVTMVTQAKGNVSLAVLLTSVTNILGVFIMPWSVSHVFAASVPIDRLSLLSELLWLTLVPLCIGSCLRRVSETLREEVPKLKKPLSIVQNCCVLTTVWLMASTAESEVWQTTTMDRNGCLVLAALVHLIYRAIGSVAATAANLPPREWVTVVLMSSQKSLPMCVSVISALPPAFKGKLGLLVLPCILAHSAQLLIDSMLAVRWEVKNESEAEAALLGCEKEAPAVV